MGLTVLLTEDITHVRTQYPDEVNNLNPMFYRTVVPAA